MNFSDPRRDRIDPSRPFWLDSMIVLPNIGLRPLANGLWNVRTIHGGIGVNVELEVRFDVLCDLLRAWEASPELAMKLYFGIEAPRGLGASTRYESGPKAPQGEVLASAKSSSELDF